jgi:hypothetical protein
MRFLHAVWALPLLALGAAGASSGLYDDWFCGLALEEGAGYGEHRNLWPPGETCHVGATVAHTGSAAAFLAVLGCGLLALAARRRLPATWCTALLLAAAGAFEWVFAIAPAAFVWPFLLGVPLVAAATRSYATAAGAAAGLALGGALQLLRLGALPFVVALAIVAAIEALPPLRRPQPA